MRSRRHIVLCILAWGLLARSAAANTAWLRNSVLLSGGSASPDTRFYYDGFSRQGTAAPWVGATYLYSVFPHLSFGADIGYFRSGDQPSDSFLHGYDTDLKTSQLSALAVARFDFLTHGRWHPYAFLGAGVARISQQGTVQPQSGNVWPRTQTAEPLPLFDDSVVIPDFGAGLGIDLKISTIFLLV